MALKVFVDFDGTITKRDVGNAFFLKFGGEQCLEIVQAYREEKISAQECFEREVDAIGKLDVTAADSFVRDELIDESFKRFVDFCREHAVEFHVVSDGLDFYISRIFEQNGINGVSVFSNALEISDTGGNGTAKVGISFPHSDAECSRCACSKRNIMLTRSGDDDIIVYIGEGYSDRCPVQYADMVFAKDELQTYCQEENISYYLYQTFDDIVGRMEELVSRKKLRPRRSAEMKRREVFIRES